MAMSLSDLGAIVGLASFVQQLGENCYRASDALNQFKSNVGNINRRYEEWQERAHKYGLSSDQHLQQALNETQNELQKEKTRLERLQKSQLRRCLYKLHGTAFPVQLGQSLQRLSEFDEAILKEWKKNETANAEAQKKVEELARAPTFAFRRDYRYIRLLEIEEEIKSAFESAHEAARIVLLHGPSGIGKSCMARQMALEYDPTSTSTIYADEASTSTTIEPRSPFKNVIFLKCGDQAEFKAKQVELLDRLGWKRGPPEPEMRTDKDSEVDLGGVLKELLKETRILIVLDDVWEKKFLEDVDKVCGQHVRILVTSQRLRLCEDSFLEKDVKSIRMDRITNEIASNILKVHAGLHADDKVAAPIQSRINDLVQKVSSNPHALACIATAIDHERADDVAEWENAVDEYQDLLVATSTMDIHGIPNPSSSEQAIQLKFGRLEAQENKLMILLAMLQGPSVPEQVVQLFFNKLVLQTTVTTRRSSTQFSKCRRRLQDLHCIEVDAKNQNSWSIHFLDQQFVQKTMHGKMHSMAKEVQTLPNIVQGLESDPQIHFLKLLGALYFGEEWGTQIIGDLPSVADLKFNPLTKKALEPIILLMIKNIGEDWSERDQLSADQVFISYMVNAMIHPEAARTLLRSPLSKKILCKVIVRIVQISDISLGEDAVIDMLKTFGDLNMSDDNSKALVLNLDHCDFLFKLARTRGLRDRHSLRFSICRIDSLMLGLVKLLSSKSEDPSLNAYSALVVGCLAFGDSPDRDQDRQTLLVDTPMLIEGLVRCLEDTRKPRNFKSTVQECAAESLANLVGSASDWSMVRSRGSDIACQQLVKCLGPSTTNDLQYYAAWALFGIAQGGRRTSLKIFSCPNAVTYLLGILNPMDSRDPVDINDHHYHPEGFASLALAIMMCNILPLSEPEADVFSLEIESISDCLAKVLGKGANISTYVRGNAVLALTSIDPARAKGFPLFTAKELKLRGQRLVQLGYVQDALRDLERALQLEENNVSVLCCLSFAKSKVGDWEAALRYADSAVERSDSRNQFVIQERGVLRRMMGDLSGALNDFDESLKLSPNDYETLKHRAYIKSLIGDKTGAVADAEHALRYKPTAYDVPAYENSCLGTYVVEFLGYRL